MEAHHAGSSYRIFPVQQGKVDFFPIGYRKSIIYASYILQAESIGL